MNHPQNAGGEPVKRSVIRLCLAGEYTLRVAGGGITFVCAGSPARRCRLDVTSRSLGLHFVFTSSSLRLHFVFTSSSLDSGGATRAPIEQEVCNDVGNSDPSISSNPC